MHSHGAALIPLELNHPYADRSLQWWGFIRTGYVGSYIAILEAMIFRFHTRRVLNVDMRRTGNEWCHNCNAVVCRGVAAQAPVSTCIYAKQELFFACTTRRKLTQRPNKCTNSARLWQRLKRKGFSLENDTNFALRGMPGASYESITNEFGRCRTRL